MKKLLFAGVAVLLAAGAFAREAKLVTETPRTRQGCMTEWTPFALTLCGPVGLPWGDWDVKGLQIGLFNSTCRFSGLQLGVVNVTDYMSGLQIGVVNVITTDDCSFLPIVNWSF